MGKRRIEGRKCWKVALVPHPDAGVVWGKVLMWISQEGYLQLRTDFYDEDGARVRTFTGSNIRKFGDRTLPAHFEMVPVNEPGKKTVMDYREFRFDKRYRALVLLRTEHETGALNHGTPPAQQHATRGLLLRLAWRNLWRNPRRTLIAMRIHLLRGLPFRPHLLHAGRTEPAPHRYGRRILHRPCAGTRESVLGETIARTRACRAIPCWSSASPPLQGVDHVVPRLETVALVARGTVTKVVPVFGVDPLHEDGMTGFGKRLVRGTTMAAWKEGALIGAGLARMLGAIAGDTLVLYGQGYQGVTAAGLIRVAGILEYPIPDMNNAALLPPTREKRRGSLRPKVASPPSP